MNPAGGHALPEAKRTAGNAIHAANDRHHQRHSGDDFDQGEACG